MILENKVNKQTFNINDIFVSIPCSRHFFKKYQNLQNAKFSTREIGDTCRFAKFILAKNLFSKQFANRKI